MAYTQVKICGLADDAVTGAKIADDTEAEANMANDAISLTELKAGTDGQIISWDANGNPVAVGPGNSGQVLTSNGSGAAPTFQTASSGATINNATANELVTVASTTTQLDAEANLTFDGNNLTQTTDADGEGIIISTSGNTYNSLTFNANRSSEGVPLGAIFAKWNGNVVGSMQFNAGSDTTNKDDGFFDIRTAQGGTNTERVRIHQAGLVDIRGTSSVQISDGDLIIGTAGHGISFASTADSSASGISNDNELLDDYEEGDWDPTLPDSDGGVGSQAGWYVKIGKMVIVQFSYVCLTNSDSSGHKVAGFPFPCNGYSVMTVNSENNEADNGLCLHMTIGQSYGHIKNQENDEKTYANFNNCQIWGSGTYMTTS